MKLGTAPQSAAGSNAVPATPLPGASGAAEAGSPPPSQPVRPVPQHQPPATAEAAMQAAAKINEFLKSSAASVEFTVEGASDRVIVRVIDSATRHVIRQMPSEEAIAISRSLDRMTGLLVEQKA